MKISFINCRIKSYKSQSSGIWTLQLGICCLGGADTVVLEFGGEFAEIIWYRLFLCGCWNNGGDSLSIALEIGDNLAVFGPLHPHLN